MLTPDLLRHLRSPEGAVLLLRAADLVDDPFAAPKLRAYASPALAAAAVDQVRLRRRARARFPQAAEMWFAPELLDQASAPEAAAWRARRYPRAELVADLCCGLGSDALALAARGPVVAVDEAALAAGLTEANAAALGFGEAVDVRVGVLPAAAPEAAFLWMDPGRRPGGRRTRRLGEMSPPMQCVLELARRYPGGGVKLSPATDDGELDQVLREWPHQREFISVSGECRELVLWFGSLLSTGCGPRRASLLPAGAVLEGVPQAWPAAEPVKAFLLEPNPAVIRGGLVGNLGAQLGAAPVDPHLAYLTAVRPVETPFGEWYRVWETVPFSEKVMASRLRALGAGDVVLKTRGFAAAPETLRRALLPVLKQGDPGRCPVVFVTRLQGRPTMILGERCGT